MRRKKYFLRKSLCLLLSATLLMGMFAGCGNKVSPEDEAAAAEAAARQTMLIEVNQNDYRGAFYRAEAIKSAIIGVIDMFNERNTAIESERPSDFWNSDSYKYLNLNLLNNEVWLPTVFLNETETDWDTAAEATYNMYKDENGNWTVAYLSLTREEANQYKLVIQNNDTVPFYRNGNQSYYFTTTYKVSYDGNHDWAQCVRYREGNDTSICDGLFEYARISDTEFVIQTSTERMYIRYEDGLYDYDTPVVNVVEGEGQEGAAQEAETNGQAELHNPLGEKPIKEFYYSQLNGEPRYEYAEIVVEEGEKPFFSFFDDASDIVRRGFNDVDENNKWVCVYDAENDSIFNDLASAGSKEWVFQDNGRFKQCISYYDSMMVVKNENTLVDMLECTNFFADGTTESYEEDIYVPEIVLALTDSEIMEAMNETSEAAIPALMELSTNGFNFGERTSFENRIDNRNMEMVDYDGKKYNINEEYELRYLDTSILNDYVACGTELFTDNTYALPEGKMYFVSTMEKDVEGNRISDNENYYTMLYEYEVQDAYTLKYNSYFLVSDNPDCKVMLQNIKPRSTTRTRVEAAYGKPIDLTSLDILDGEGLVQYTVSYPSNTAAYRCENGIIYVQYNAGDIVELVGMYCFDEQQSLDTIYAPAAE